MARTTNKRNAVVLAKGLSLPPDAATQTFLIVGKRGSGKSTTAVRMAEQLHAAGVPFVVIDPVDTWWGLKADRGGRSAGLAGIYVFGGRHADLPLESTAGALIADTLVEHRISAVLSVKHLSGRERGRFVTDLAKRLFQKNTQPLMVFSEEAHETAPQQPMKGEEEMLGAITRLVKLGRSSGIGFAAITQRPASLSKNVTTQAEVLIVHRTLGPQDVAAIKEWIKYHGEHDAILGSLSTLVTGEAFVWAPDFPERRPIGLKRVQILPRETFDSSATPKAGERRTEPKRLAVVDLDLLRSKMTELIERAKQEDPVELKRQVTALKRKLTDAEKSAERAVTKTQERVREITVQAVSQKTVSQIEKATAAAGKAAQAIAAAAQELVAQLQKVASKPHRGTTTAGVPARVAAPASPSHRPPLTKTARGGGPTSALPKGERAILIATAQHSDGVTRSQLSVLTGFKTSTRNAYIQRLRDRELVTQVGETIHATSAGVAALGDDYEPLPTGEELRTYWLQRLPEGEAQILALLTAEVPNTREEIGEATGYKTSTRNAYIHRLSARRLVVVTPNGVLAAKELFDDE